jgi:hypothetical protein
MYVKTEASTGTLATIRFYYLKTSIFNEIKLLTAYRSRTIKEADGKEGWDEFTVTDSERDFFNNFLQYVLPEVFGELAKIASGVPDSVFAEDDSSTGAEMGFSLKDNEAYDDNLLTIIDGRIRKCFVLYCLKEWWLHTAYDSIAAMYELKYRESLGEMKRKAWQLIKPLML